MAVSIGTPTMQASRVLVSLIVLIGSLMKEAMPAGLGRSFWWVGLFRQNDAELHYKGALYMENIGVIFCL